ncbi:MAG: sulfatase family protein [Candidatus Eiseniibacteriota bacterium]
MTRTGRRATPWMLLAAALGTSPACAAPPVDAPPNIVVVVIDTARRDFFSAYGHGRSTTPRFDAFAGEGIRFDRAYSTSCWTVPAHASLFTGLWPVVHRATQESEWLDEEAVTLAELLRESGFETVCLSGNPWISAKANLAQGFETADVVWTGKTQLEGEGLPHKLNRGVFRWLDARRDRRPFFLFVNYIEPHWKYQAPTAWQEEFVPGGPVAQDDPAMFPAPKWYLHRGEIPMDRLPTRTAMYEAELAYADAVLGELLDGLRSRGLLDEALVVVTSDHGENHGDLGHVSHMLALNEALIRVPLAVRPPGGDRAGTVRDDRVQLADLFPTILAAAGVAPPASPMPTYDLLSEKVPPSRPVLAEYYYPEQVLHFLPDRAAEAEAMQPYLRRIRALVDGNHKLVWGSDGRHELYDLTADPTERANLADAEPTRVAELVGKLTAIIAPFDRPRVEETPAAAPVDPKIEEQLRALGYTR